MMPKLPKPDEYLCFFDEGGMHESNEMGYSKPSVRSIQEEAYKAGMAAAVPDGWKVVPGEPTREMWDAINKADDRAFSGGSSHGADFETLWSVALEAVPEVK